MIIKITRELFKTIAQYIILIKQPKLKYNNKEAKHQSQDTGVTNWAANTTYSKGQVVEYKQRLYQAMTDYGNLSKPDDLCSKLLFEIFNHPSRTYVFIHTCFALSILVFTFFAVFKKRGVIIFLGHLMGTIFMMWNSFNSAAEVRKYAFINQMKTG